MPILENTWEIIGRIYGRINIQRIRLRENTTMCLKCGSKKIDLYYLNIMSFLTII